MWYHSPNFRPTVADTPRNYDEMAELTLHQSDQQRIIHFPFFICLKSSNRTTEEKEADAECVAAQAHPLFSFLLQPLLLSPPMATSACIAIVGDVISFSFSLTEFFIFPKILSLFLKKKKHTHTH